MSTQETRPSVPLTQEERITIKEAFKEYSHSCSRIDSEKELMKEILSTLQEKFSIKKAVLRKLALLFHEGNLEEKVDHMSEIEEFYRYITEEQK